MPAMRQRLKKKARRCGLENRIRWHGIIPEASQFYAAFDVFVLSSRREGTPIVLLEAMAAHAPIVATAVGGVPDVLSHHEAILVPAEDPAALAEGIRTVFSDRRAAIKRAGQAYRRLRENHSLASWVEQYDRVYAKAQRACR